MKDLCHDVFGVLKEKKDPKEVKGNRGNNSDILLILYDWYLGGRLISAPYIDIKANCSYVLLHDCRTIRCFS